MHRRVHLEDILDLRALLISLITAYSYVLASLVSDDAHPFRYKVTRQKLFCRKKFFCERIFRKAQHLSSWQLDCECLWIYGKFKYTMHVIWRNLQEYLKNNVTFYLRFISLVVFIKIWISVNMCSVVNIYETQLLSRNVYLEFK